MSNEPSPSNLVAVITPLILTLPTTLSLYPFAVVPIPTPSSSTANRVVPDPTCNVFKPGVVVPTPTSSKVKIEESHSKLIGDIARHSLSVV